MPLARSDRRPVIGALLGVEFDDVRLIRRRASEDVKTTSYSRADPRTATVELLPGPRRNLETAQLRTLVTVSVRSDGEADSGNRGLGCAL